MPTPPGRPIRAWILLPICLSLCACVERNAELLEAGIALPLSESRIIDLRIPSRYVGKSLRCKAYFPKGYGAGRRYPVLYGLNGYGSDEDMWIDAGLSSSVDELIASGGISPLILVFARTSAVTMEELRRDLDGHGELGERDMELAVLREALPYVDRHFDAAEGPEGRFIAGYSMGGMIALRIALHHPELFGKVAGYSPALLDGDFSGLQLEEWLHPNERPGAMTDAAAFARRKGMDRVCVYLDAGTAGDPFFPRVHSLHEALVRRGIPSEFHPYDGGHSLSHNQGDFRDYLNFFIPALGR